MVAGEQVMVVRNNYLYQPVDEQDHPTASFIANGEVLKVVGTRAQRQLHGFTFREAELRDQQGASSLPTFCSKAYTVVWHRFRPRHDSSSSIT